MIPLPIERHAEPPSPARNRKTRRLAKLGARAQASCHIAKNAVVKSKTCSEPVSAALVLWCGLRWKGMGEGEETYKFATKLFAHRGCHEGPKLYGDLDFKFASEAQRLLHRRAPLTTYPKRKIETVIEPKVFELTPNSGCMSATAGENIVDASEL